MQNRLTELAQRASDFVMAIIPRRRPDAQALAACRIVSHRGEHDNRTRRENTMAAFRAAEAAGVWGLETDIRWTADMVPVVIHDPDTKRVFGPDMTIADVTFAQLREAVPEVPSLEEFIAEFGGRLHLMLELKAEPFPQPGRQKAILRDMLSGLEPGRDYHLMALDPALFATFDIVPPSACLPVAMLNAPALSRAALETGLGGLTGHYVLITPAMQRRHEAQGQKIGTGFIRSRNNLYREINRGAEWVFTNDAAKLCGYVREG